METSSGARYDTFVMTGDMIIKTTSSPKVGPATKPKPGPGSTTAAASDGNTRVVTVTSPQRKVSNSQQSNGTTTAACKSPEKSKVPPPTKPKYSAEVTGYEKYVEPPLELDIPPDDISSEDERYKVEETDIDVDDLPPPPEFFFQFDAAASDTVPNAATPVVNSRDGCTAAEVVRFDLGEDIDSKPLTDDSEQITEQTVNFTNCLDEAIAKLEMESREEILIQCPPHEPNQANAFQSLPGRVESLDCAGMAVSRSTEKITYGQSRSVAPPPFSTGVRGSKSQENCLRVGNGSGTTLVTIDMNTASSTSLDALAYDTSTGSSQDSVGRIRFNEYLPFPVVDNSKPPDKPPGLVFERAPLPNEDETYDNVVPLPQRTCNGQTHESKDLGRVAMPYETHFEYEPAVVDDSNRGAVKHSANSSNAGTSTSNVGTGAVRIIPVERSLPLRFLSPVSMYPSEQQNGAEVPPTVDTPLPGASNSLDDIGETPRQLKDVDRPSACRLAKRLYHLDGFRKTDISKHLCKKNDFSYLVGEEFVRYFDFAGLTLDGALREFLKRLVLSGETQERERILAHFSRRYLECNPRTFNSEDACHTLTCAIMLLNTDLHRQNVGRKMTLNEFVENLADLNDGDNFPVDILSALYQSIRTEPIMFEVEEDGSDEVNPSPGVQQDQYSQGLGHNPFLDVPDPSKTVEYKKGFVMRKCCTDPDGRKTGIGRRGWKMCYAVLCDMVLYLHKDERSYKQGMPVGAVSNALRVHHALASRAADYTKKQHVFRLHMADWSQCLLQTSNSDECQSWINTINFVAAFLSAPPLPGACGSQKKFQRPLMPCSYTRLSLKEQLAHHERYLEQILLDLADHAKYPPEKGAKTRVIQDYIEKETYLKFEQTRFRTYCTVLHMRLCTPQVNPGVGGPSGELSLLSSPIGEVDEQAHGSPSHPGDQSAAGNGTRNVADRKLRRLHGSRADEIISAKQPNGTAASDFGQKSSRSVPRYAGSPMQSARSVPVMYETRV